MVPDILGLPILFGAKITENILLVVSVAVLFQL